MARNWACHLLGRKHPSSVLVVVPCDGYSKAAPRTNRNNHQLKLLLHWPRTSNVRYPRAPILARPMLRLWLKKLLDDHLIFCLPMTYSPRLSGLIRLLFCLLLSMS